MAVAVETPRGWRIAKEKQRHKIDVVVALAMASLAAIKQRPVPHAGLLEWYRIQSQAVTARTPAPTPAQEHGAEAVMQVGTRRPANHVKVAITNDSSTIVGQSGHSYVTEMEGGHRVCWMDAADALVMIGSAFADPRLREANADLPFRLGNVPLPSRSIKVTDLLQAQYDARPRSIYDKGGMINDTLRAMGRVR